jgi:hypothetical protein
MCLAVCNVKMGGCGHMGDDREWARTENACICPVCRHDFMYLLHDYNLDAVVDPTMVENAKVMLNDYYAQLRGKPLRRAYRNGNVPTHRLTGAFKKEIGLP